MTKRRFAGKLTDMSVSNRSKTVPLQLQEQAFSDKELLLLGAAAGVFSEKGFHDTRVSDIVAACGVAQGTFYLYFSSKKEIYARLLLNCCASILDRLREAGEKRRAARTSEELRANLVGLLKGLFQLLESERRVLGLLSSDSLGIDPTIDGILLIFREELVAQARRNLMSDRESGLIRALNPTIISEALVGMVYHLAFERFVHGRDLGVTIDELVEEIVAFELRGIAVGQDG